MTSHDTTSEQAYRSPAGEAPPQAAPQPATSGYAPYPPAVEAEPRGFSIAALVLGLVSIVAGYTFFVPIAGLVLGIIALKREPAGRTMAIWGTVLSGVMLAGTVLIGLVSLAIGIALLPFGLLF
ncbi:DUF4190 domain-containing protein [Agromyces archimandritae]|uniref:DUF4190 domain-containing protein n=1 Tax=Agromyces archimandritae TaxID=2781962 RepID=A0A975FQ06_9MICO|nr:DUF4190 domain-containing protein [Agromyces archimandritae]QTX05086.1 DUF4190 domain-containing protein [Agromyces archimandritae]